MKRPIAFIAKSVLGGFLIIIPIYLAVLLLLKGMKSMGALVQPFTHLLPASLPAAEILSLLLMVVICFLIGLIIRTSIGELVKESVEKTLLEKIPGYALFRSLANQAAGKSRENVWKPALFRSDEALIPAFIIEEFEDGRYTVFVPSIPTPFAGAVYILEPDRVFPVDVPFTEAIKVVSHWGSGSKALVMVMERQQQLK